MKDFGKFYGFLYILPFDIFYDHLVNFVVILVYFWYNGNSPADKSPNDKLPNDNSPNTIKPTTRPTTSRPPTSRPTPKSPNTNSPYTKLAKIAKKLQKPRKNCKKRTKIVAKTQRNRKKQRRPG
jgi:hypothetical protein